MEDIAKLVNDSLARHGIKPISRHGRLEWSGWFRCESSLGMLLAPAKPGIFALAEEVCPGTGLAREAGQGDAGSTRMLALFQISEADDLGMALGRLFLPGNPARPRLVSGCCFARYAVIEDRTERLRAQRTFEGWIRAAEKSASEINPQPGSSDAATPLNRAEPRSAWEAGPEDGSFAGDFLRGSFATVCPLPSGF
ncbi:MAG: hypothetical protein JO356_14610 [Acidobacteria bacterium]|nr:hypothetical protein [Acidobacteriota bacterium]